MGAEVNTSEKSFFVLCKPELRIGAIPAGNPNFAGNLLVNAGTRIETRDSNKCTWLVCPHLAEPQLVYDYYMASGLITIVLGKCFCERPGYGSYGKRVFRIRAIEPAHDGYVVSAKFH